MNRKGTLLLTLMLCIAMVLTACTAAPATPSVPATNTGADSAAAPDAAAVDASANEELIILTGSDFSSLDPQKCNDSATESANKSVYNNLVTFDPDMNIVPDLAESWEVSDDSLTWTFKLRQGVKFHDGTNFTAEAVKMSYERILNPDTGSPNRSVLAMISEVKVVDDYTVAIVTADPCGAFLSQLSHPAAAILSPAAVGATGLEYGLNPVGTGPFKFVEWVNGDHATFVRNDDYFGDKAKVGKVTYRIVPDNSTRALLLESGEGDIALRLPTTEIDRLEKKDKVVVERFDTVMVMYVPLNQSKAGSPFKDVRVRQALNYATDKEAIINDVLGGMASIADSPLAPGTWGYHSTGVYPYDVEKAKALLAEAGYPSGIDIAIWTTTGRYPMDTQVGQILQGQWEKAGIHATIQQWETQSMFAELKKAKFDTLYMGWSPSTVDGDRGLDPFNTTTTDFNFAHYSNPELDAVLEAAAIEVNLEKRAELYKQAQQIIFDEAPWVFLYYQKQAVAYRANISGLHTLANEHILLNDVVKAG